MVLPALRQALVVGSVGGCALFDRTGLDAIRSSCDILEIRLDTIAVECAGVIDLPWDSFAGIPVLCTARRRDEGGSGDWDDARRMAMLDGVMPHASCLDIEVASIPAMGGLIDRASGKKVPWIASFHDFTRVPDPTVLEAAAHKALAAGAAAFKVAGMVREVADLVRLVDFQRGDHGLPVATMGMGALAPVSRLLCAQYGSVLNYGYLGSMPTAPGQWEAGFLREAIRRLPTV